MSETLAPERPATSGKSQSTQVVFDRYAAAWRACDAALIASLHSKDSTFWIHDGTPRVFGREAVQQHFAGIFAKYPGFDFDVYRVLIGDRHWVLDWALKLELPAADGAMASVRIDMVDIVDIDDVDQVTRKDTFYDGSQASEVRAAGARLAQA